MSMSYQASELLVENVRDLSVRLLMLNYLYNIKCQDTTIETQHSCVHLSLLTSLSLRLLTQGNGNSWSLQGLLRHYHGCVWSSSDCWWLHVSILGWGLLPLALGLGSAHMHPLTKVLMITWGTFPQRQKQSCWLVSRVDWWPTSKDAGCDLKHQEWARKILPYENRWWSLGKKNGDIW